MGVKRVLLVFVMTVNLVLHAAAPVALKVYPAFQFAPGHIRLTLTIEPDAANRSYCLFWEGSNSGSQCRDLDGDREPRTRWVEFRDQPAGAYVAVLTVAKSDSSQVRSTEVKWEILDRLQ